MFGEALCSIMFYEKYRFADICEKKGLIFALVLYMVMMIQDGIVAIHRDVNT